jgi:hypothetical protein
VDLFHFTQREELLLFNEHQLDKVFIQHLCWRNVKLQLLLKILDEIILGTEASKQFLSQELPFLWLPFFLFCQLNVLHSVNIIVVLAVLTFVLDFSKLIKTLAILEKIFRAAEKTH